jgi:hypothetical protein
MDARWKELERMAMAAFAEDAQIANQHPSPDTIEQWKRLFGYSHMKAVCLIGDQRGDGQSRSQPCRHHMLIVTPRGTEEAGGVVGAEGSPAGLTAYGSIHR